MLTLYHESITLYDKLNKDVLVSELTTRQTIADGEYY
jgi:hypothetical protein